MAVKKRKPVLRDTETDELDAMYEQEKKRRQAERSVANAENRVRGKMDDIKTRVMTNSVLGPEVKPLIPTHDYVKPNSGHTPGPTYQGGYLSDTQSVFPSNEPTAKRPATRKSKTVGKGKAYAMKGKKAKGAENGVGQPSVDGFIEGLYRNRKGKK